MTMIQTSTTKHIQGQCVNVTALKPVRQQVTMNQCRGASFTPATTKISGAKKRHINSSVYGRTAAKGIALKIIWYALCAARSAVNATGITNNQRNHVGSLKMSLSTHCCTSISLHLHNHSYTQLLIIKKKFCIAPVIVDFYRILPRCRKV
jgi:hypothetical protein